MSRTAEIKLTIDLDGDQLPTRITWQASEAQHRGPTNCQSAMLALWDSDNKTTAAIDLWTKEMTIDDMNIYVYQVIPLVHTSPRITTSPSKRSVGTGTLST